MHQRSSLFLKYDRKSTIRLPSRILALELLSQKVKCGKNVFDLKYLVGKINLKNCYILHLAPVIVQFLNQFEAV